MVKDRRGNPTTYTYDPDGNVTEVIDALGHKSESSYDSQGNERTSTDALGHVVTRTFDTNAKRLLTETDPLGHTIAFAAGSGEANSDLIPQNGAYVHRFNRSGTYAYYCTPHPFMKGVVVVR